MKPTKQTINHCNSHKLCKGCPFVGGKCVAPESPHKFGEWIEKMNVEIKKLYEKR